MNIRSNFEYSFKYSVLISWPDLMYQIFIWIFIPFLNILEEYWWISIKILIWIAPQHGIFFSILRYSQRYSSDQLWLSWIFTWIVILIIKISTWKRIFLLIFLYSGRPWPVTAVRPPRLLRYAAHRPPFLDLSLCFQ